MIRSLLNTPANLRCVVPEGTTRPTVENHPVLQKFN
jgi:hypothetical protein